MESFPDLLRPANLGTLTLPSGPSEFEPCFRTPGLPTISCPPLKLLLLLGDFPLDRGRLSPCPNQDLDDHCPVTRHRGQSSILRQDLYDRLLCMYETNTASVNAKP